MIITLQDHIKGFAENKDIARNIRKTKIISALDNGEEVILDFRGISSATQSFVHALLSEPIRTFGPDVLDVIKFKNCNEEVRKIIEIVIDYLQES